MMEPINNQLLYQIDSETLDFEAVIERVEPLPKNQFGVALDRTYFYPTGGGQEHDSGCIGDARVIDVYKSKEGKLIHVVDRELAVGNVSCHIDPYRRTRHMQHHTAQHLLSQCFFHLFNAPTVSANINFDSPSTVDLAIRELGKTDLDQAEDLANSIIYKNRSVKAYFVSPEKLSEVPLRRPPKVHENIRIIEIDGFDYSACGGTHVTTTGAIGIVKITRTERVNDKLRVHFVAGQQALEVFRAYYDQVTSVATRMDIHPMELDQAVQRLNDQLRSAQRDFQTLRSECASIEAKEMVATAQSTGNVKLIQASFTNRSSQELRNLALEIRKRPGYVATLGNYDGEKLSLVVSCSDDCGISAREVLTSLLQPLGGRGGGDKSIAQGGGLVSAEQFNSLFERFHL